MLARKSFLILVAAVALSAPVGQVLGHGKEHNPSRFDFVKANDIPSDYRERVNPLDMTKDNLVAGEGLYANNCASCHGAKGDGGGEAATDLNPPPAVLTGMYDRPMTGMGQSGPGVHMAHGKQHHHPGLSHAEAMGGVNIDAYNFWAVSEGGEPLGSSMPAFEEILTETERWQILLYLANGFSSKTGE